MTRAQIDEFLNHPLYKLLRSDVEEMALHEQAHIMQLDPATAGVDFPYRKGVHDGIKRVLVLLDSTLAESRVVERALTKQGG